VVALEDVSRAEAPSETIAQSRFAAFGTPPIAFTVSYDRARIRPDHNYIVRAWIVLDQTTAQEPELESLLAGPSWQLVIFQGSDGTTLTPDDRPKYTIEFEAETS
jgi:hypothetical protein